MKKILFLSLSVMLLICNISLAAPFARIDRPPLSERWFGIYVDNDRVGFYRQVISEVADGYRMDGNGVVRMKVMGFSKEASMHEVYHVGKNLGLRSFDVEQTINSVVSHVTGKVGDGTLRLKSESNGKVTDKTLKFKGEVYPGPALNIYPVMKDVASGKVHKILTFDPEELKVKEVKITVLGEEKTPEGKQALKLRNSLYPFVNNDIWVDAQGNTLFESVREGLVTTKVEDPKLIASFISSVALAKKDLIYDFSLVRVEPPLREPKRLTGMSVDISGWNDAIPLLQDGGQQSQKSGDGRVTIKTGSAVVPSGEGKSTPPVAAQLAPADKIESDAPEIVAKARELVAGSKNQTESARILAAWTADWLKDTIDDGGSAIVSFKARTGNCQTHSRLYTALARAAGIPTRFVSGLVYQEGKGFLYHSWTESFLAGKWVSIDPTFNQLPSDPTHLKLFEGHTPDDLAPIIAIIGRIRLNVLETKY